MLTRAGTLLTGAGQQEPRGILGSANLLGRAPRGEQGGESKKPTVVGKRYPKEIGRGRQVAREAEVQMCVREGRSCGQEEAPASSVPFTTTLDRPCSSDPCQVAPDHLGQHIPWWHGWLLATPACTRVFPADPCFVTEPVKGLAGLK